MPAEVNEHDSTFIINDVELSIPPTSINIRKNAQNFTWQSLRTSNAIKVKSGHGTLDIDLTATFVGPKAINEQLIPLVAQLKLTPICYIENQYVRDNIQPRGNKNMAFIMKNMSITVQPELVDTVVVNFSFGWFNYLPYVNNFEFKRDTFEPIPVSTPARSIAWRKFYFPEVSKYKPLAREEISSDIEFIYNRYDIGSPLESGDFQSSEEAIREGLRETLEDATKDLAAVKSGKSNQDQDELVDRIIYAQQKIQGMNAVSSDGFKPTGLRYKIGHQTENNKKKPDPVLWRETNRVSTKNNDALTCTGITISFQNIVSCLPVIGHQYMTYQYVGSIDPVVIINLLATTDSARKAVTTMWDDIEQNALDFRYIRQEFLNTIINNDLVNAFIKGYETIPGKPRLFITDSFDDKTVPGQPGTWSMSLGFRATNYSFEQEQLEQEFVSDQRVRNKIIEIILNNIGIVEQGQRFGETIKYTKKFAPKGPAGLAKGGEAFNSILTDFANELQQFSQLLNAEITSRYTIGKTRDVGTYLGALFTSNTTVATQEKARLFDAREKAVTVMGFMRTFDSQELQDTIINTISNITNTGGSLLAHGGSNPMRVNNFDIGKLVEEDLDLSQSRSIPSFEEFKDAVGGVTSLDDVYLDFQRFIQETTDQIMLDGRINLPEFAEAKELMDKVGSFRGKSTYTDFTNLQSVADTEGINVLDVEPDFYFYNHSIDKLSDLVDPGLLNIASDRARSLYVNTDPQTEQGFATRISNFVENHYIKSLDGELKNKVVKDWDEAIRVEDGKTRNAKGGAFVLDKTSAPNIATPSVENETYRNAAADTIEADSYLVRDVEDGQDGYYYSHGIDSKSVKVRSNNEVKHYGSFDKTLEEQQRIIETAKAYDLFERPVNGTVTSNFGPRNARNPKASHNHEGTDYRAPFETPVRAAADGQIVKVGWQNEDDPREGYGYHIVIKHENHFTLYAHLTPGSEQLNPSASTVEKCTDGSHVSGGDIIALSGASGSATYVADSGELVKGPHLHFEIRTLDWLPLDPEKIFRGQAPRDTSSGEGFRFGNSIFSRSIEQMQDDLANGQALRMNRAYPTFKLYFIEEDGLSERRFGFDDFFSYNSVKSIRNIRSRKIPADLCVIELTNVSGILSNRKFDTENVVNPEDRSVRKEASRPRLDEEGTKSKESVFRPQDTNTSDENPIAQMMLQEGTKTELRLGYSNDPDKLDTTFVGQIVEVEFNETDDLVTIVCQSYATELAQNVKGLLKPETRDNGWFVKRDNAVTEKILTDMLHQPEVVHFGRWIRSRKRGGPSNVNRSVLNNRFELNPRPEDDNIFAPPSLHLTASGPIEIAIKTYIRNLIIGAAFGPLNTISHDLQNKLLGKVVPLRYYIYKTTIWEVFKEMELRHPECISSPVPYKDTKLGPRMTMFFGIPNQLYFARDPSIKERAEVETIRKTVESNSEELDGTLQKFLDPTVPPSSAQKFLTRRGVGLSNVLPDFTPLGTAVTNHVSSALNNRESRLREKYINHIKKRLALRNKSIKPFRSYHMFTSDNHIVANNIRASAIDVYNTISVGYFEGNGSLEDRLERLQSVKPPQDVFRMKVDAALPDEKVQETFIQYPSCEGKTMAKHYALSQLKRELKEIYKGELVVLGNPKVKPYDVAYIFDEYTDMIGPVEVEQVVHVFSQETGFITEITPDLCVTVNEWTTLGTMDVVGLMAENVLKDVFKLDVRRKEDREQVQKIGAVSLGISLPAMYFAMPGLVAGGLIGAFALNKVVEISQFRHPYTFSPLLYKGRPYMAGVASKAIPGNWWSDARNWVKDGVTGFNLAVEDFFDSLTIEPRGDILSNLYEDSGPQF